MQPPADPPSASPSAAHAASASRAASLRSALAHTRALHALACEAFRADPDRAERAAARAHAQFVEQQIRVPRGGDAESPVSLAALVLDTATESALGHVAERLHAIIERVLERVLADPALLALHFGDHRRMFPHLRGTPGLSTWQGYSRYDAVLSRDGRLRVIELNTGCPSAFINASRSERVVRAALAELLRTEAPLGEPAGPPPTTLAQLALGVDARSGIAPGLIAVLNDENALTYEIAFIRDSIEAAGRAAVLAPAQDLERAGGRLAWRGRAISTTFDKFRISTPLSPNHCWKDGFEARYRAFLGAVADGAVAPINNLAAMTVAEDKGLLALLHGSDRGGLLTVEDAAFVDEHVAWTARLSDVVAGRVALPARASLTGSRGGLVVKPANEGRGFRVHIGCETSPAAWADAIRVDPSLPCVVQEFVEPVRLGVLSRRAERLEAAQHHATVSLALVEGRYVGCFARASHERVSNTAREGAVVAVLRRP